MTADAVWPWFRSLLRRHARCGGRLVPLALLSMLLATGVLGYGGVAQWCAARGRVVWDVSTRLDEAVPTWPWTIVVYLSFQVLFVVAAFSAPRDARGQRELVLLFQSLFGVGVLSLTLFVAAPCEVLGRDALELHSGAFAGLIALVHRSDPPWNAWPSLHVSQSLLCALALARWRAAHRLWLRVALAALWIAISLSTLTTKQHYIFDVLTGAWLGWAAWTWYLKRAFEA